jgi:hypothetical protein
MKKIKHAKGHVCFYLGDLYTHIKDEKFVIEGGLFKNLVEIPVGERFWLYDEHKKPLINRYWRY